MKIYAVRAIAELAKKPVPPVVSAAYNRSDIHFGRDYIIPTPLTRACSHQWLPLWPRRNGQRSVTPPDHRLGRI